MELGQRLKQARLEAGLSQRQLCEGIVTRNMLSQIENGSARPSMDTLRAFCARLGKPMGYFLEEHAVTSPNQALMAQARTAAPLDALALLKGYQAPDAVFDPERWLIEALACLAAAEAALNAQKTGYARTLLEQAAAAGRQTPYYTQDLERRRLLLSHRAGFPAQELIKQLPDNTSELMLRAEAALQQSKPELCSHLLDSIPERTEDWYFLQGECKLSQKDYAAAAAFYQNAPQNQTTFSRLEHCYRELEDYKQAYFYACKQK